DEPGYGARLASRQAISADGRRVLFTAGTSSLPRGGSASTPPAQLWLRDLSTKTTRLITRDVADASAAGQPVVGGAAAGSGALSADGNVVVGLGDPRSYASVPAGEVARPPAYLWRDLSAPAPSPARRVSGPYDADDPGCDPTAPYVPSLTAAGPCYG